MDDWAQTAADAVLENLMDRRGVKQELCAVQDQDPGTFDEIRTTLAGIIRDIAKTDQSR